MNLAFIGSGNVGAALAVRLAEAGHTVVLAQSRDGSSTVEQALGRSARLTAAPLEQAVAEADIVFLATPFSVNQSILEPLAEQLAGKILVDCTNPVGPGLSHGLKSERSGSEFIQSLLPKTHVIKAFTIYGFENLNDSAYPDYNVLPVMMFAGDDSASKAKVAQLISDCHFEPLDVGGLNQALHLEHMTLLWVRMVRAGGHSPHLVWAALRRTKS